MLILRREDINNIFTMQEAIAASKEALSLHTQGKSVVPLRVNIGVPQHQGQSLFMPAYVDDLNAIGVKIVSVFPKNIALGKPSVLAQMILLDGTTGEVAAMLDGTCLTQLRTGALQGLATDILARKDANIAVLFGTGGQARTQLEAMLTVRNIKEVRVFDIDFARAQQFVENMRKEFSQFKVNIVSTNDCDQAINDADIITTITTSKTPVFNGRLVKKGAHINGIGAYTPEMQELPEEIIRRADKIYFDTREGVLAEAGDIINPLHAGIISMESITGNLGDVICGSVKGRVAEEEITLFKAVGTAVLDLVVADKIYKKALQQNVGQQIAL